MRRTLLIVLGLIALSGCAANIAPAPINPEGCAISTPAGEPDGGYGGTGNAPEDCPPAQ